MLAWQKYTRKNCQVNPELTMQRKYMKTLSQLWEQRICPTRSGIYFANDNVRLLEVTMPWENKNNVVSVELANYLRLDQLDEIRKRALTRLAPLCNQSYPDLGLQVFGGEGSHGSEGFIALVQTRTGHLTWLAYFDCSNPFEKVSLESKAIIAFSNLQHRWVFPIDRPEEVTASGTNKR